MNAVSILRTTKMIGAREFRQRLDQMLRHPAACRVMLYNKPAFAVLPDDDFLALLEILEELRGSGVLAKIQRRLQAESKKKNAWFWSKTWQKGEREADREAKAGRVRRAGSVDELLGQLKA